MILSEAITKDLQRPVGQHILSRPIYAHSSYFYSWRQALAQHTRYSMRKISLDVNALRVESFDTAGDEAKVRGTVQGYITQFFTCPRTQCGQECLSGPQSCFFTEAFTDGQVACFCNTTDDTPL